MSSTPRRRSARQRSLRALAEAMERRVMFSADGDLAICISPVPPSQSAAPAGVAQNGPLAALTVPAYSSLPSAAAKIYLDFDGQSAVNWGSYSVPATPAYTVDGDATNFSALELSNIQEIWARVAEKYTPFNIDVTTVRPSSFANNVAIQVVIGGNGAWMPGAGGVAYLNAFSNSASNTCWVFSAQSPSNLQFVAEAAAHEAGHTFGLEHQSEYSGNTKVQEYSDGDPSTTGNTINFSAAKAPIMGVSYYATRGVWSNGRNASGSVQNDMTVIASATNGFGYRTDDYGNAPNPAGTFFGTGTLAASGVIEKTSDSDYFGFKAGPGAVSFTVAVPSYGMLDATLELRDASDTLISSRDTASFGETLNFTLSFSGTYYIVVKSHGTYGDVGAYSLSGSFIPEFLTANAGTSYTVAEGSSVTLSGLGSTGPIVTYEWDTNYDGITFNPVLTGATPTFSAANVDGPVTRTIALRITDIDSNTAIATATLTVTNAKPKASAFTNSGPVLEGSTTATVSFVNPTDPSPADVTAGLLYSYDFDNDGTFDVVDSSSPVAVIPAQFVADGPATFVVRGRVADKDGAYTDYTTTVKVTNIIPTATFAVDNATVNEGGSATVSFTSPTDSAADVTAGLLYSYDFNGDGVFEIVASTSSSVSVPAQYLSDGPITRTIRGRIADKDGAYTNYTTTLTVLNVAPTATPLVTAGDEGTDLVIVLSSPFDPSAGDTTAGFRYSFDFGGDGTFEIVDSSSNSYTRLMTDQGTYTVVARIKDRNGGFTDYTITATPANVAPTSSFSSGGTVTEGSTGTVSFGFVNDPSDDDTVAGFTYSYDFDNDGTFEIVGSPDSAVTVPASFLADGPFVRTIRGRVSDKDGGYTDYTTTITVLNVDPTLIIPTSAGGRVVLGTGFSLSLAALDPGQDTISSWTVNWGDGRTSHASTPTALFSHDYDAKGAYTVIITAADDDGSAYTLNHAVNVTSDPPTATLTGGALTPDASAFQFTIVYSDDLGIVASTLDDADVSVTGPHGPAKSVRLLSAVPTGDGRGIIATYEATGPVGDWGWQDDGTYTVSVNPGQIIDLQGDTLAAGPVGDFSISLVAPNAPDLVATYVGALKLQPSGKNTATVKVYNRGTRNLPVSKVTTSLYLSADPVWDPSDILLASSTSKYGLIINDFKSVTFSFPTPSVSRTGKYYLVARTDTRSAVFERSERNNATASNKIRLTAHPHALAGKPTSPYKAGAAPSLKLKSNTSQVFNLATTISDTDAGDDTLLSSVA